MTTQILTGNSEVRSDHVATAIGPFSQALLGKANGRLLAISGQGGFGLDGKLVATGPGCIAAQTERIFENIRHLLQSVGGSMKDLLSLTVYLKDEADYAAFNRMRMKYLTAPFPASATVAGIGFVVDGMAIEISAVAVI